MVDGYDPASFDIVREEFQRDDDEIDRLREEERRLSEQRDIDRDRLREQDTRTSNEVWLGKGFLYYTNPRSAGVGYATPEEARAASKVMEIVNDDTVTLTPEMVEIINDPMVRMTDDGKAARLTGRDVIRQSGQFARSAILPNISAIRGKMSRRSSGKKRKVSKYQKEFGKQLKMLKAKHPRTKITRLMKRAHSATRKALK
jgi:hypothetical protein